jgi:hypothetical protein
VSIQSEVQYAVVDYATSGDNTLVAAVTGKKIRVVALAISSVGALLVRLESGASGTPLTGQMALAANGTLVWPYNPAGWCETAAAALLNLELSAATSVDGVLGYVLVE